MSLWLHEELIFTLPIEDHCSVQFSTDATPAPRRKVKTLRWWVSNLERLLGRKTIEVEILKEALDLARSKNSPGSCPHGTASYLAMNGARLVELAGEFGYKTQLVKRYAHFSESDVKEQVKSVNDKILPARL